MAAKRMQPVSATLERMKRELEEQCGGAEQYLSTLKLASMGNMVGGVTHTLNNILGGILGYSQLLKEVTGESAEALRHAEIIEKAAKRASKVVSQLQIISERDTHTKSVVDPKLIVHKVVTILSSSFNRNIKIKTDFKHESAKILANQTALCQVLLNICLNAKSAMSQGGELCIETEVQEKTSLVIKITDTGQGMKSEFLPYLFEPFVCTEDSKNPSGLGLAIAQEIIHDHKGEITVESEPDAGSTFTITLPVTKARSEHPAEQAEGPKQTEMKFENATLLVVDDEEELRTLAQQIFERKGFNVLAAGTGEEAIKLYRKYRDKINLVILDMILPGEDGPAVFKKIKKVDPKAEVILTSGYVTNSPFRTLIENGAAMFVPKPWDLPQLVQKAQTALDR